MKKLEKEELSFLQEATSKLNQAKNALGDLELKKHQILVEVDRLKKSVQEKEDILVNKYGPNSVINMQTGEVTQKQE